MDKYVLFLLTSSSYQSDSLQEKLIANPKISENFLILRVKPPHILYELREITSSDLPMLIFGDNVVMKGDSEVISLLAKEGEFDFKEEEEAYFASRIMEKFLPILSSFEAPEEQELFDHSSNIIEDLLFLIMGALVTGLPHMKTFLEINDLEVPEYPVDLDVEEDTDSPNNVVDLDFDENFLANFWQFSLSPPKFSSREWVDFLYELYNVGMPISTLVKALAWYLGRYAARKSDMKMIQQVQQLVPPSWGQFNTFNYESGEVSGGIDLNFYFTNPYGWDLMFFAFFLKGCLETVKGKILKPFNIYYNAESKYFEFTGTFQSDDE